LRQIQRQCLFQDHDIDALTQLRAQQRLGERNSSLCHRGGGNQQGFQGDITHYIVEVSRTVAMMQVRGVNYRIDNLRAHISHARRQHAGNQGEHGERDAQGLVGAPDQPQGAAAVLEDTRKIAAPATRSTAGAIRRIRRAAYVRRSA